MANKKTAKSCYDSRYGGGWITARQRLAEMACERISGGNTLGVKFWKNKPWDAIFCRELSHATNLLAKFPMRAIVQTLSALRVNPRFTLGAAFLKPLIEIEFHKLQTESTTLKNASIPESINTLETPRKLKRAGKSIREKLIDNGPTERGLFNSNVETDND